MSITRDQDDHPPRLGLAEAFRRRACLPVEGAVGIGMRSPHAIALDRREAHETLARFVDPSDELRRLGEQLVAAGWGTSPAAP